MFTYNLAFNQLVARGRDADDEIIKGGIAQLYRRYLCDEKLKPYVALDCFGVYGTHQNDWKDEHAINYILFSNKTDDLVMLISHHTFIVMLEPDPFNIL